MTRLATEVINQRPERSKHEFSNDLTHPQRILNDQFTNQGGTQFIEACRVFLYCDWSADLTPPP